MYPRTNLLNNQATLQGHLVRGIVYLLSMGMSVAGTQQNEYRKLHLKFHSSFFFNNLHKIQILVPGIFGHYGAPLAKQRNGHDGAALGKQGDRKHIQY